VVAARVFFLPGAGQGPQHHSPPTRLLSHPAGDIVTVQLREADAELDYVGPEGLCRVPSRHDESLAQVAFVNECYTGSDELFLLSFNL
jgi:hypothetical protein